jgi:hypothetical protein
VYCLSAYRQIRFVVNRAWSTNVSGSIYRKVLSLFIILSLATVVALQLFAKHMAVIVSGKSKSMIFYRLPYLLAIFCIFDTSQTSRFFWRRLEQYSTFNGFFTRVTSVPHFLPQVLRQRGFYLYRSVLIQKFTT